MTKNSFGAGKNSDNPAQSEWRWKKHQGLMQKIGIVFLIFSLALAKWGWGVGIESYKDHPSKVFQALVIVVWILGPPIWFWYQFHFGWRVDKKEGRMDKRDDPDNLSLEEFNTYQDLSSKIWVAVASALLLLYFWQNIKR